MSDRFSRESRGCGAVAGVQTTPPGAGLRTGNKGLVRRFYSYLSSSSIWMPHGGRGNRGSGLDGFVFATPHSVSSREPRGWSAATGPGIAAGTCGLLRA